MPDVYLIDLALAEKRLSQFVRQAWPTVEPSTDYCHGWHIDAICEHLEAVTLGQITRLIINIPPRHMKSLLTLVFWPAWEWGPRNMAHTRWLCSSYADTLSVRDSLKCRRLISSPWYQERWGDRFMVTTDQNQKTRFDNNKAGYRIATSVRGVGTGEGGDRIVVDDPHNIMKAESVLDRMNTLTWWDESMSTRINHPDKSAKVIIQQRAHQQDLSGHCMEKETGYVYLCLPARYESDHPHKTSTPLDWEDPRTIEGEPLWKELYHDQALKNLESEMTEYARAGQLQQRPAPRGGGMFKVERIKIIDKMPPKSDILYSVRYWDKAATDGGGANSAGVLMHKLKGGEYLVSDVRKGQWSYPKRNAIIKQTARLDGVRTRIHLEQEPGSGGKESAQASIKELAGYAAFADRPTGDKTLRAEPFSAQVEGGNVSVLNASWTADYIEELSMFPASKLRDQVDASSGAFKYLSDKKEVKVW